MFYCPTIKLKYTPNLKYSLIQTATRHRANQFCKKFTLLPPVSGQKIPARTGIFHTLFVGAIQSSRYGVFLLSVWAQSIPIAHL